MKVVSLTNNRNAEEMIARLPHGVIGFFKKDSGVYQDTKAYLYQHRPP